MNRIFEDLLARGIVVCDGAVGTMLHSMGVPVGQSLDELNLTSPDMVIQVHTGYLDAGAQVIETNTFGANRIKLEGYGLARKVREINTEGAKLAKQAVAGNALVAGSVGPTGKLMEPLGPLSFDLAYEIFREQIAALCEGGVDLLIIETMQDLREAKAALLAAKTVTEVPVICQMSFAQEGRTVMGTEPATAAVVLEHFGARLIGTNCGSGPQDMLDAVTAMSAVSVSGVTAQPNAGMPRYHDGRLVYISTPAYLADFARRFAAAGAVLVGGCCGTTSEHIRAVAEAVRGLAPQKRPSGYPIRIAGRYGVVSMGTGKPVLMGNRLSPDASQQIRDFLSQGRFQTAEDEAAGQSDKGAQVIALDLDALPSGNPAAAAKFVEYIQMACSSALCLYASDPVPLESALRAVEGRPIVAPSTPASVEAILPVAARYGAAVLLSAVNGDADSPSEERLRIAYRMMEIAGKVGIRRDGILVNPGSLFDAQGKVNENTVKAIGIIKADPDLGVAVEYRPSEGGSSPTTGMRAALDADVDVLIADPSLPDVFSVFGQE